MARRQISIFINGKQVAKQITPLTKEKRKLLRALNKMTVGSEEYMATMKELDKINPILNGHRKRLHGIESTWQKVTKGVKGFAAVAGLSIAANEVVQYGKELFRLGVEMDTLNRKAAIVFGDALPKVDEAARQNAAEMGLTTGQYINNAAAIGDLLIPMGFFREEAADISTGLVDLSGALSEWTGGQKSANEISEILSKALLGEREQLKTLGISILEADVKNRVMAKGMDKATGKAREQARAMATLELITEKSADAQTAFSENSDSLIRKQQKVEAQFQTIKETIATALIPIWERLFEVIMPVVEGLADGVQAMTAGKEAATGFGKALVFLVEWLDKVWKTQKLLWKTSSGIALFLLDTMAPAFQFVAERVAGLYNNTVSLVNVASRLADSDFRLKLIDTEALGKDLDRARQLLKDARKDPELREPIGPRPFVPSPSSPSGPDFDPEAEKKRRAAAERAAKELEKREKKLLDIVKKFQQERFEAELSEEDKKLEQIRLKYEEQIGLAKELEAKGVQAATEQRLELERLKEMALKEELDRQFMERQAQLDGQNQQEILDDLGRRQAREEARRTAEAAIAEELRQAVMSERELAIYELEQHYQELLDLAELLGIDTLDIEIAHRKRKEEIDAKFDKLEKENVVKSQQERLQALQATYRAFGDMAANLSDIFAAEGEEAAGFQRALTLFQIAADTASAISSLTAASSANPANAVTFGAAGAAQFAAGLAQILGNIARAKRILFSEPVPQRFMGGFTEVKGQTDGRKYRARYIGDRPTGMLDFDSPVLTASGILANERGPEYFVASEDLRRPAVLDHVRAIENITRARQFQDGGATAPLPDSPQRQSMSFPPEFMSLFVEMKEVLEEIRDTPRRPLIGDDEIAKFDKRLKVLERVSGGTLDL